MQLVFQRIFVYIQIIITCFNKFSIFVKIRQCEQQQMTNKCFRVNYWLQSLQTKTKPLFTKVRAYLLTEGDKRLIKEGVGFKNSLINFNSNIQEKQKIIPYDQNMQCYKECKTSILFEFQAEGRFIKLGEVHINLADILNYHRNKQLVAYKIDRCYDRNAKILISVTLQEIQQNIEDINIIQPSETLCYGNLQSFNHSNRNRSTFDTNKSRNYSNPYQNAHDNELQKYRSLEINKQVNLSQKAKIIEDLHFRQIQSLQAQVDICKNQMTLNNQKVIRLEKKIVQIQTENKDLRARLVDAQNQIEEFANLCGQLKNQIAAKQKSKQNQKQKLSQNANKYLKLFQQSEVEKNKISSQINKLLNSEKEKLKQLEKKIHEEKVKVKYLQKNQLKFKKKDQDRIAQIMDYEKALKAQKTQKQKLQLQLLKMNQKYVQQKKIMEHQRKKIWKQKEQLNNELEISKFSLRQLQIELEQLKKLDKKKIKLINEYENQIQISKQTLKNERINYSQKIQEIQIMTQKEHKNIEVYMEQLQVKTINQRSKINQIYQLQKQISKLKRIIDDYQSKSHKLQAIIIKTTHQKQTIQRQWAISKSQNLQILAKYGQIEKQLRMMEQHSIFSEYKQQQKQLSCMNQNQRNQLIAMSFEQRDLYWKDEIDKIQKDTRCLIQKSKKEKENYQMRIEQLNTEIQNSNLQLKKIQNKLTIVQISEQQLKKNNKLHVNKINALQKSIKDLNQELDRKNMNIKTLQSKSELCEQLEIKISQIQNKLNAKNHQSSKLTNQLDSQIKKNQKLARQVRQMINCVSIHMSKSEKQKLFFDQIKLQQIGAQSQLIFNSSLKIFCQKHNKIKLKLQELEQLKHKIENNQKMQQKQNKSNENKAKLSRSNSFDSVNSKESKNQSILTAKYKIWAHNNSKSISQIPIKEENGSKIILKNQIEQLKLKNKKQISRTKQLQKQIQRLTAYIVESRVQVNRLNQELQQINQQAIQQRQRVRIKQKQLQNFRQQNKDLTNEIQDLKSQLQHLMRQTKMQRYQGATKEISINRISSFSKKNDYLQQPLYRVTQLQKKYKLAQQQIQKYKKEDNKTQKVNKQIKIIESKLKEKDKMIAELKKQTEQNQKKHERQKQLHHSKIKQIKQANQEQNLVKLKNYKILQKKLLQYQQKSQIYQKKIKLLQEKLNQTNNNLASAKERQEVNKKILQSQWQLKIKNVQSQYQGKLLIANREIQNLKQIQKKNSQINQVRDKQLKDIKIQLQRKTVIVGELEQKLEIYEARLKSLEDEENRYQQTIQFLQKKVKLQSIDCQSRNLYDKQDNTEIKSNFSLKTFTFR